AFILPDPFCTFRPSNNQPSLACRHALNLRFTLASPIQPRGVFMSAVIGANFDRRSRFPEAGLRATHALHIARVSTPASAELRLACLIHGLFLPTGRPDNPPPGFAREGTIRETRRYSS